jgi:plastocyanin
MEARLAMRFACLALAVAAGGCGGDDGDGGGGSSEGQRPVGATGGETVAVSMDELRFDPENVTVSAGGTVVWTNHDSVPHDVDGSGPGGKFTSGRLGGIGRGGTYFFTFEEPGSYEYVCRAHTGLGPGMGGTITVK